MPAFEDDDEPYTSEQRGGRALRTRSMSKQQDSQEPTQNSDQSTANAHPDDDDGEYFVVEKVLKYSPQKNQFLIKWLGYPGEDSWVPSGNLQYNMIARYIKQIRKPFP